MMISIGLVIGLVIGLFYPEMSNFFNSLFGEPKENKHTHRPVPKDIAPEYAELGVYTSMASCVECGLRGERNMLSVLSPCPDCGGDVKPSRPSRWAAPMKGMDLQWIEKPSV